MTEMLKVSEKCKTNRNIRSQGSPVASHFMKKFVGVAKF